jgi:hypothetical protein
MQISSKKGNIRAVAIVGVFLFLGLVVSPLAIKYFSGSIKGKAYKEQAISDGVNIATEFSSYLSDYNCAGSGNPSLTFSSVSNGLTTFTFKNGVNPCHGNTGDVLVGPPMRIFSTSITGSLAPTPAPGKGILKWCIAVRNVDQIAIINDTGYQAGMKHCVAGSATA